MRLLYVSSAQIPSRSTNALQVIRMCEAFGAVGAEVTLVHPHRIGNRPEGYGDDIWEFYGVESPFKIITLPTPLTWRAAHKAWLARPLLATTLGLYLLRRSRPGMPPFVCYSRSLMGVWLALCTRRLFGRRSACQSVFLEAHDRFSTKQSARLLAGVDGLVAISGALRDFLVQEIPALGGKIWVAHDGVDLKLINPELLDAAKARGEVGLVGEGPLITYAGRVNPQKGAGILLDAAMLLRDTDARFALVGKVYDASYKSRAAELGNVVLTGYMPPARVPAYLAAADVLVLPTTPALSYSRFTSPLKMFEYMASGRPIIASDLPVIREVLQHDVNAVLYEPESADALAHAVLRLSQDKGLGRRLASRAWEDVQQYSWDNRASRILEKVRETTL